MPLPKRCVEPVLVSRGTVPERLSVPSELEAVTNGTLANTVRQLSSLSKHAEDMFGELARDAGALSERANQLQARIDRLAVKVTQLDSGVEEVSIQDIQMRKAFRSTRTFDQQIFSRGTMPTAMLATYARCDRPPPLDRLNAFRDDGRDALKFYTDPGYFFELWRQEMLQDTERIQHDRGKKVRQPRTSDGAGGGGGARRVRVPHSTRERQRAAAAARGEHIMPAAALARHNHHHQQQAQLAAAREREQFYDATIVDGRSSTHSLSHYASQQQLAARPSSIEIANAYLPYQQRSTPLAGANGHGMEEAIYMSSAGSGTEPIYGGSMGGSGAGTPRRARPSVPPPAPPAGAVSPPSSAQHTPARATLPPPPPPPETAGSPPPPLALTNGAPPQASVQLRSTLDTHLDEMHNVIGLMSSDLLPPPAPASPEAPPPPPPPPPPAPPAPPAPLPNGDARPPPPSAADLLRGASGLKAAPAPAPPLVDPRSDLLKAIRDGIKLRKVEKRANDANGRYNSLTSNSAPGLHDVASILARRVAVELSDTSSSEGESDDLDSDGGWGESRA